MKNKYLIFNKIQTKCNKKNMHSLILMFSINAIFLGMTGHPINATFSPLILHNVHLGPNASNCRMTFLCSTHQWIGNHIWAYISWPILLVVNHVEMDIVYRGYTFIRKFLIDNCFIVVDKTRTCNNDMWVR